MPTHGSVATSALALVLVNTAACGALSGDTGSPSTLVTIHGTITSSSASSPAKSLATAIVWFASSSPDGTVRVSADSVPISGSFPASFTVDVRSAPPASAMTDLGALTGNSEGDGVNFAQGLVVAYDDRNGNGQLDLVDASAAQYVDAVEGVADQVIIYLDKPLPAAYFAWAGSAFPGIGLDGSMPHVGYNLLQERNNYCFANADAGAGGTCLPGTIWNPVDSALTLPLGNTSWVEPFGFSPEEAQELMCSSGPNKDHELGPGCGSAGPCNSTISVTDFSGTLPSASDSNLWCIDLNNFEYTSSCSVSVAGVCQTVNVTCTQLTTVTLNPAKGPSVAPPADWPCAAQPTPSAAFMSWYAEQAGIVSSSGGSPPSSSSPADGGASSN